MASETSTKNASWYLSEFQQLLLAAWLPKLPTLGYIIPKIISTTTISRLASETLWPASYFFEEISTTTISRLASETNYSVLIEVIEISTTTISRLASETLAFMLQFSDLNFNNYY